jgi:hypothetical protein
MSHLPPVFQQMPRFGFVHHRALNSRERFRAALTAAHARPDLCHILEGDLCWHVEGGRRDYYFRHPRRWTDVLDPTQIDAHRADGRLWSLHDALTEIDANVRFIVELKTGRGDTDTAIRDVVGMLQDALPGRYWLDGFSLRLLASVKRANPSAPTSLHTKLVLDSWVLRSAPEVFPLSWHRLATLAEVDAVTLTYSTSPAGLLRWLGATIDGTCRGVTASGKTLILGGLTTPASFDRARSSIARAGYAKFPLSALPKLP